MPHGIGYTDTNDPRETLEAFDRYLTGRRLRLDAVVIGARRLGHGV
jgi:hypothetical protein